MVERDQELRQAGFNSKDQNLLTMLPNDLNVAILTSLHIFQKCQSAIGLLKLSENNMQYLTLTQGPSKDIIFQRKSGI